MTFHLHVVFDARRRPTSHILVNVLQKDIGTMTTSTYEELSSQCLPILLDIYTGHHTGRSCRIDRR